jgi:hypothetical protein
MRFGEAVHTLSRNGHDYRLGAERLFSPQLRSPPEQELREDIEASLEDIVLEKSLLRE